MHNKGRFHSLMPHDPILRVVQVFVILAMGLLAIPISALIYTALAGESGFTLGNLFRVTRFPQFWPAMGNTLISGVGTVCTMMLLAVPLTWLYTRTDLPRKSLLIALVTINVAIPSFLVALGYIFIFNPSNGVFNVAWRSLAGTTEAPVNIYSLGWIFFLQGIALSSPAFFMMVPTFQGIDTALEEAASANGVRRWKATLFIVLPLAAPVILAVSAYYFIIAIEMFDYAGMLGLPVQVYVASGLLFTLINDARALPRYPEAASLGLIMATVAMFLAIIYLWAVRKADRYVTLTGKPRAQVSIKLSRRGKDPELGVHLCLFPDRHGDTAGDACLGVGHTLFEGSDMGQSGRLELSGLLDRPALCARHSGQQHNLLSGRAHGRSDPGRLPCLGRAPATRGGFPSPSACW